jgi:WD40 repeat protein
MNKCTIFALLIGLTLSSLHHAPLASGLDDTVQAYLGQIQQPTTLVSKAAQACWSPCGNFVAFTNKTGNQDTAGGIHTIRVDGQSQPVPITQSGKDPVWSPDGKWLAYVDTQPQEADESVWLVDAKGEQKPVRLADGGYPNWAPDSTSVIVHSRAESALYAVNIQSKQKEKLFNYAYPYPCLSPNAQRAVFPGGQGLVVQNLNGENKIQKEIDASRGFLGRWSPDGQRIAFAGFPGAGMKLSVIDSQLATAPISLLNEPLVRPAWSPDGTFLVADTGASPYEVWIIPASARAKRNTSLSVSLDVSEVPHLTAWGEQAKQLIEEWYARTVNLLPSKDFEAPNEIRIKIANTDQGVAWASGPRITVASHWIEKNPDDIGCVYHEMVHVIQNYKTRVPSWIVEGIADYMRWAIYESKPQAWFPFSDKADGFRDSYRVTAGFFLWLESTHAPGIVKRLNSAGRSNRFEGESIFENEIGIPVETLWAEYLQLRKSNS